MVPGSICCSALSIIADRCSSVVVYLKIAEHERAASLKIADQKSSDFKSHKIADILKHNPYDELHFLFLWKTRKILREFMKNRFVYKLLKNLN